MSTKTISLFDPDAKDTPEDIRAKARAFSATIWVLFELLISGYDKGITVAQICMTGPADMTSSDWRVLLTKLYLTGLIDVVSHDTLQLCRITTAGVRYLQFSTGTQVALDLKKKPPNWQ